MPLYEYECAKCGGVLEALQKLSDAPLAVHENCGGALTKRVSTSALHFKGTGWYVTDYAKGSRSLPSGTKSEAKEAKTESPKPAADSKPAAESKPAPAKS
jgi:putative FmdB family regulatory protein